MGMGTLFLGIDSSGGINFSEELILGRNQVLALPGEILPRLVPCKVAVSLAVWLWRLRPTTEVECSIRTLIQHESFLMKELGI
jgi:hypothetical protein